MQYLHCLYDCRDYKEALGDGGICIELIKKKILNRQMHIKNPACNNNKLTNCRNHDRNNCVEFVIAKENQLMTCIVANVLDSISLFFFFFFAVFVCLCDLSVQLAWRKMFHLTR